MQLDGMPCRRGRDGDGDEHAEQLEEEDAPASLRRISIVMLQSLAAAEVLLLHGDIVDAGEARRDDRSPRPVRVAPL